MDRLLLDIGATSIKSVHQSNDKILPDSIFKTDSFSIKHGDKFDPEIIVTEFLSHIGLQFKKRNFKEVWLCSEMHNFTAYEEIRKEYSDFYSWRYISKDTLFYKDKILEYLDQNQIITGQSLHQGIPLLNFSELEDSFRKVTLLSLPELIVFKLGRYEGKIDKSMAASYGCYDIDNSQWDVNLLKEIYPNIDFKLPKTFDEEEQPFLGSVTLSNKTISLFGGFGDMQTAIFGSGIDDECININIGTGSQVSSIIQSLEDGDKNYDLKPFFGKFLKAITHIPAGRSLEYLNKNVFKDINFWSKLNLIELQEVLEFDKEINFDLNIFPTNWRYNINNLKNIKTSSLDSNEMYLALLKVFCNQYREIIDTFNKNYSPKKELIISGGRLKDIPVVREFFKTIGKCKIDTFNKRLDETLLGLHMLSTGR